MKHNDPFETESDRYNIHTYEQGFCYPLPISEYMDEGIDIYTDGASRGNPGKASWAYIVVQKGNIILKAGEFAGICTNNKAEYTAIINALEKAVESGWKSINIYSDSQLVVRQINGEYKVRDRCLQERFARVKKLLGRFESASFTHVPRSNPFIAIADATCNQVLDEREAQPKHKKIPTIPVKSKKLTLIELIPIGIVHSPYKTLKEAPHQGRLHTDISTIELFPEYEEGLHGLSEGQELIVQCWFDRAERDLLTVIPSGSTKPRGVFSTRSPARPNPVALQEIELVSLNGRFLTVRGIDAIDGTVVIDIKPALKK